MGNIQVNEEKNLSNATSESPANRAVKHPTPRPWKWERGSRTIRSSRANYWLATMDSWDGQVNNEANAELIVRAVNSHDALVAAARVAADALRIIEEHHGSEPSNTRLMLEAALKLAEVSNA